MITAYQDDVLAALAKRAIAGDNQAAALVLAQPRRIKILDPAEGGVDARSAYLGLWGSLAAGNITVPEAGALLEILDRVQRYLS